MQDVVSNCTEAKGSIKGPLVLKLPWTIFKKGASLRLHLLGFSKFIDQKRVKNVYNKLAAQHRHNFKYASMRGQCAPVAFKVF